MRQKLKSAKVQLSQTAAIHDRQATEMAADRFCVPALVEDPYDPQNQSVVTRSLRDDPLGWMRHHHQVDEAQYRAGRRFQRLYEAAMIGGLKAMDTMREPVDGGGISAEVLTEHGRKARVWLVRCAKALGMEGEALIRDILGRGLFIAQVAAARGLETKRELEYLGRRFRECLETLAKEFGYA